MGLIAWLKSLFSDTQTPPHVYIPSALTFTELDVPGLIRNLQLSEEGEARGKSNQPTTARSEFDNVEARIVTVIQSELAIAQEKFIRHMRAFGERQASLKVHGRLAQLVTQAASARSDFIAKVGIGQDLIWKLANDLKQRGTELQQFREENQLKRSPRLPESRTLHWGVIGVLVLIESALNGVLLARGDELGALGGVTQALVIALMNVGVGYGAGRYLFTNINHIRTHRKAAGALSIILWISFAFVFNLAVAHYRAALGSPFTVNAERVAMSTLLSSPFELSEISGWLLFLLGCSFSLIAAVDGWSMDDPYPGYGRLADRLDISLGGYTAQKQELATELEDVRNEAVAKIDNLVLELEQGKTQYNNLRANQAHLREQFKTYVQYLQNCGNELLAAYRQANLATRSSPAPSHFDTEWKIAMPSPQVDAVTTDDTSIDERITGTFEEIKRTRHQIEEDYQSALKQFRSIESLVEQSSANEESGADAALSAW